MSRKHFSQRFKLLFVLRTHIVTGEIRDILFYMAGASNTLMYWHIGRTPYLRVHYFMFWRRKRHFFSAATSFY